MSKMAELHADMVGCAMDCIMHGFDDEAIESVLQKEFGWFANYAQEIIAQAKQDCASYHDEMMHSVYSYEEVYGR